MLTIRFDHPEFLWLGLLAFPLFLVGWRVLALADGLRRAVILTVRVLVLLLLAVVLAGPRLDREHDHLTVIGVLDISGSVKRFGSFVAAQSPRLTSRTSDVEDGEPSVDMPSNDPENPSFADGLLSSTGLIEYLRQWFRAATNIKTPDDRFGLIVFDGKAIAISAPTRADYVDDNLDTPLADGTNIEDALRLALAMFPPDTAKRIVLATDGNETAGNVREAVKRLGGSDVRLTIPIDVLPIAYRIERDVQLMRVETPPTAQPGQTVTVRIMLESTVDTTGVITLLREGQPVNISGSAGATGRRVNIPAGSSVHLAQVTLGQTPVNRFEAIIETDDPTHNLLPDNDRAEAFTATPSKGSTLVIDPLSPQRDNLLAGLLNAANIPAQVRTAADFPNDLLSLQNHDLIILDNVAAHELSQPQQELLARYVNDLGGGLIMVGGENSFGAGGWKGSPVADLLPVEVDPSRQLRLPTAALVLVLDKSGSMRHPVAGARATQQQVANEGAALAIQSLNEENLIGVVTFDSRPHVLVPVQRNDNPKKLMDRVRSISPEGGTALRPALRQSMEMLKNIEASRKHVVFLTDGRSSSDEGLEDLAQQMADADIQLTTIAVGDDADHELLEKLAQLGGGEFYPVRDPRRLPNVLLDSVQIINRPLIKEATFSPIPLATGSTLTTGMSSAPPLHGMVITSIRDDPKVSLELTDPEGDPVLAHWQHGLGRVAAFTSEVPGSGSGGWAAQWIDWPTAATFWTQLVRLIARPAANQDAELIATIQDDRLQITLEVAESDEGATSSTYMQVEGTVYQPDGSTTAVRLRQTAPGRFETSIDAPVAGNYIVALNPRQGARQLTPVIGGASRSTSPEFRKYVSNLALLEEIVQETGGRRLNVDDPAALPLFDREGLPRSVSSLPAWRMFLLLVLAVLLLDVASRRIAWDSRVLRGLIARAVARMTPARLRGAEAAATLATLRRVSDEVDSQRERRSMGVNRLRGTGRIAPPPLRDEAMIPRDDARASTGDDATLTSVVDESTGAEDVPVRSAPSQRATPDETQVNAALDALLGRTSPKSAPAGTSSASSDGKISQESGTTATETTSNLLAAKRRARERMNEDK